MRLGLSNKITQPHLRGAAVVSAGIERTSITLEMDDTWIGNNSFETRLPTNGTNIDGRYYNVKFPFAWVRWDEYSYGSAAAAEAGLVDDPFEDYREAGDVLINGAGIPSLPAISANLDITINIDDGIVIGGYTYQYLYGAYTYPSLLLYYSHAIASGSHSSFTEEAAKNLKITINNSGSIGGAGGPGGWGDNNAVDKGTRDFAGGGGGGAGIHRRLGEAENDWGGGAGGPAASGTTTVAGVGGHGGGIEYGYHGTNRGRWNSSYSPSVVDDYDTLTTTGVGGDYGLGQTNILTGLDAAPLRSGGGNGGPGGHAISVYNPLAQLMDGVPYVAGETWALNGTYASDWVSNWSGGGGPELIINNNSDGYIRGGGGGGGGGSGAASGWTGGAGGLIGQSGSPGFGQPQADPPGINNAGLGGPTGSAVGNHGTHWPSGLLGVTQPYGTITKTNANSEDYSFFPDGA